MAMCFRRIFVPFALSAVFITGCHTANTPPTEKSLLSPNEKASAANQQFLSQKQFDPWLLTNTDPKNDLPAYFGNGKTGYLVGPSGHSITHMVAGQYQGSQLQTISDSSAPISSNNNSGFLQTLDFQHGTLTTKLASGTTVFALPDGKPRDWPTTWQTSNIAIDGDPEAQQATHANLFYLLSSTASRIDTSIPPLGLSSGVYGGHIFWDADVWMLPALVVQHPDDAQTIVDYRFKTLGQARKNAKSHGYSGAEYAWESAGTGEEVAPAEFARERHITADVGFAAWQYYLWTGDFGYLRAKGWPLLQATAQYWVSRVQHGSDGKYHITQVLSPDETAGLVDDDAYTNAVVRYNLTAATYAAHLVGASADPKWAEIANGLNMPFDAARGIPAEHNGKISDRFAAKQADTLLLIHPLNMHYDAVTEGKMLDFYSTHTIKNGPAMTASIHAVVAAKLGRDQQALDAFHDSYRPFMRAPWDAFSEKRTTNNVYFMTGMAGCVQSVLYGFAGLRTALVIEHASGTQIALDNGVALVADPHLPPGWQSLTIRGIRFHGKSYDLTVEKGNRIKVTTKT